MQYEPKTYGARRRITSFLGPVEDKARRRRESVVKRSGCTDAPMRRALRWNGERRPLQDLRRSQNQLQTERV